MVLKKSYVESIDAVEWNCGGVELIELYLDWPLQYKAKEILDLDFVVEDGIEYVQVTTEDGLIVLVGEGAEFGVLLDS